MFQGRETTFILGRPIFRGYVSFREGSNFAFSKMKVVSSDFQGLCEFFQRVRNILLEDCHLSDGGLTVMALTTIPLTAFWSTYCKSLQTCQGDPLCDPDSNHVTVKLIPASAKKQAYPSVYIPMKQLWNAQSDLTLPTHQHQM